MGFESAIPSLLCVFRRRGRLSLVQREHRLHPIEFELRQFVEALVFVVSREQIEVVMVELIAQKLRVLERDKLLDIALIIRQSQMGIVIVLGSPGFVRFIFIR